MDNIELGKRLKQARISCNYTMEDIAKKIGVAKSTIQRYENGKIEKIKLPIIESIAGVLNVNPSWLIGKSENMKSHKNNIILGTELDSIFQKIRTKTGCFIKISSVCCCIKIFCEEIFCSFQIIHIHSNMFYFHIYFSPRSAVSYQSIMYFRFSAFTRSEPFSIIISFDFSCHNPSHINNFCSRLHLCLCFLHAI